MRSSDAELLIIPGLGGSGPDHWQTRWEQKLSTAHRVEQRDWEKPRRDEWVRAVASAIEGAPRPVVLIAHSLGVIAAVHVARETAPWIKGAFLVAPPSEERLASVAEIDPAFRPFPRGKLRFSSVLVASRDDTYSDFAQSEALARDWGAKLIDAGAAGHINADSGHGPWPEGLLQFAAFMRRI
ncbi:MAG: serine hydrolase family protein [Methylobacteriaceae bacterium]|nr:serine hydrolase family protein [Methylobacteriaceae bacterium]